MRHKPLKPYCGLTILLDRPSRFDDKQLISGFAGSDYLKNLFPLSRLSMDIRTLDTLSEGFLPGTKVILALGDQVHKALNTSGTSMMQHRGSPYVYKDITVVTSFPPQDAYDIQDYEGRWHGSTEGEGSGDEDEKGSGKQTPRGEWKFWLSWDTLKAKGYLTNPPVVKSLPKRIYPPLKEVQDILKGLKDEQLYLDIETIPRTFALTCIGLGIHNCVYVLPCRRYNSDLGYSVFSLLLRDLAVAMARNTTVIHNSSFDLFVLAWRYGIPFGRSIYDTMHAHHRIFPCVSKSLGHCVSLYTDQPYHKNEGVYDPKSADQDRQLWEYNAKDIESMILVREAIDETASTIKGAPESIRQVNASIAPYLTTCLHGARWDMSAREKLFDAHDKRRNQMLRLLRLLLGKDVNPSSPKQMQEILFKQLKLDPIKISSRTKAPSADALTLLQFAMKYPDLGFFNIILDYRSSAKLQGALKTYEWNFHYRDYAL